MGSSPRDEFCLITCMLKHLQGRVQMFAICFKMHQKTVKALMDGGGVASWGPHAHARMWAVGNGSAQRSLSGFAGHLRTFVVHWGQPGGAEGTECTCVARLCFAHAVSRLGQAADRHVAPGPGAAMSGPLSAAPVAHGCHSPQT